MKNSKLRRALLLLACAVLLVSLSVGATLAYLTAQTPTVVNTFTVGQVIIKLDEAVVDVDGVPGTITSFDETTGQHFTTPVDKLEDADRGMKNWYKLMPNHLYTKDPTVYVDAKSEPCYIFVKVVNPIAAIEDPAYLIADQMSSKGWIAVSGVDNVYAYCGTAQTPAIVNAGAELIVFDNFKINKDAKAGTAPETATEAEAKLYLAQYEGQTITVVAYAIQADQVSGTAEQIWALGNWN